MRKTVGKVLLALSGIGFALWLVWVVGCAPGEAARTARPAERPTVLVLNDGLEPLYVSRPGLYVRVGPGQERCIVLPFHRPINLRIRRGDYSEQGPRFDPEVNAGWVWRFGGSQKRLKYDIQHLHQAPRCQ